MSVSVDASKTTLKRTTMFWDLIEHICLHAFYGCHSAGANVSTTSSRQSWFLPSFSPSLDYYTEDICMQYTLLYDDAPLKLIVIRSLNFDSRRTCIEALESISNIFWLSRKRRRDWSKVIVVTRNRSQSDIHLTAKEFLFKVGRRLNHLHSLQGN